MTYLDYVAQIGGLLGLFIGFSVISGIEIIYWCTFRFVREQRRGMRVKGRGGGGARGGEEEESGENDEGDDVPGPAFYVPPVTPIKVAP